MVALHPLGVPAFDKDLGGVPAGSMVQVHGPSGAGKTTLALGAAREARRAALVLPEQPHVTRVQAVLGDAMATALLARPADLPAQAEAVERAARLLEQRRVTCVVLDSLTFLYRFERLSSLDALQELYRQLGRLHRAVRASDGVVVFTNQVRGSAEGFEPLGGPAVAHASDVILALRPLDGAWRRVQLDKHPTRQAGAAWDARISVNGLV